MTEGNSATYSEARIPRLSAEEAKAAADAAGVPAMMADLSVFQVLLHQPKLAKSMGDLLMTLLWGSALDDRLRELVIMRLGWATKSDYEWTQHWRIARGVGISEEELVALRGDWRSYSGFSPADLAVIAATDETLEHGVISESTWADCVKHVGEKEALIELVVSIGHWRLYSSLLRSLEIPLEEGVVSWPPDGVSP